MDENNTRDATYTVVRKITVPIDVQVTALYSVTSSGEEVLRGIGASVSQSELCKVGLLRQDPGSSAMKKNVGMVCSTEDINLGAATLVPLGCALYTNTSNDAHDKVRNRSNDNEVHYSLYAAQDRAHERLAVVLDGGPASLLQQTSKVDTTVGPRRAHQIHAVHGEELRGVSLLDYHISFSSESETDLRVKHCRRRTAVEIGHMHHGDRTVVSNSLEFTPGSSYTGLPADVVKVVTSCSVGHPGYENFFNTIRSEEPSDNCKETLMNKIRLHESLNAGARYVAVKAITESAES